jgi:uncharacterized membrane protein
MSRRDESGRLSPVAAVSAPLDVSVSRFINAPPERVRGVMFDPARDPGWMAAVKSVEPLDAGHAAGARVRRTGRFLGRPLRWTTELVSLAPNRLDLRIVDGPMRGTVTYQIEPSGSGSEVSIRNTGAAPGFAPRRLLMWAMRRSLAADLARLQRVVEEGR